MAGRRAHVMLPEKLVEEIDRLVGRRGRSGFIARAAMAELKRVRQLKLADDGQILEGRKSPGACRGAARWISDLCKDNDKRLRNPRRRI